MRPDRRTRCHSADRSSEGRAQACCLAVPQCRRAVLRCACVSKKSGGGEPTSTCTAALESDNTDVHVLRCMHGARYEYDTPTRWIAVDKTRARARQFMSGRFLSRQPKSVHSFLGST